MLIVGGVLVVFYNLTTPCSLNHIFGPSLFVLLQVLAFLVSIIFVRQNANDVSSQNYNYLIWSLVGAIMMGIGLVVDNAHLVCINTRVGIIIASGFIMVGMVAITVGEIFELNFNSVFYISHI